MGIDISFTVTSVNMSILWEKLQCVCVCVCMLYHKLPPPSRTFSTMKPCQHLRGPVIPPPPGLTVTPWSTLSLPDMCRCSLILPRRLPAASPPTAGQLNDYCADLRGQPALAASDGIALFFPLSGSPC